MTCTCGCFIPRRGRALSFRAWWLISPLVSVWKLDGSLGSAVCKQSFLPPAAVCKELEVTTWLGCVLHGYSQPLLSGSHVSFGRNFSSRVWGRCWRMPLVNSPLAIVGCPRKYHAEDILKSCCGVPTSPRVEPRADLRDHDLSHISGVSSGLGLLCFPWLLLGFSGPERRITLSSLSVLGLSLQPWFCWNHFWQSLISSFLFLFNFMLPEILTSLEVSNILIFTHPAASTFSLGNMGKRRLFLDIFLST